MFPRTSSRAQAIDVEHLRLVRQARLAAVATLAAVTLLVFAAISAHAAERSSPDPRVSHACAVVLGLNPSETDYYACVGSLSRSLSAVREAQAVESDQGVCAQKGFTVGTPAFDDCVVQADQSPRPSRYVVPAAP
jgi:hypothetical protein